MISKLIERLTGGSPDLEVAAVWLSPLTGGNAILGIRVANNRTQPVEVVEVGFSIPGDQKLCALNGLKGGGYLPHLLQAGANITVPLDTRILSSPKLHEAQCAYAKTSDNKTISGASLSVGELTGAAS